MEWRWRCNLCQRNISCHDRNDLVSEKLEMICIEIEGPYNKSFSLRAWYRPPNSVSDILYEYEPFLFKCDIECKEMIMVI